MQHERMMDDHNGHRRLFSLLCRLVHRHQARTVVRFYRTLIKADGQLFHGLTTSASCDRIVESEVCFSSWHIPAKVDEVDVGDMVLPQRITEDGEA